MAKSKPKIYYKRRRRQYHGNQFVKKAKIVESETSDCESDIEMTAAGDAPAACAGRLSDPPPPVKPVTSNTASSEKLGQKSDAVFDTDDELTGFRFMDCDLLINFVSDFPCSQCEHPLGENRCSKKLSNVKETRSSMCSIFEFSCECGHKYVLNSSKKSGKTYEVNRRFAVAMFSIGRHHQHGKRFLGNMNMPPPPHKASWAIHKKKILAATKKVSTRRKNKAAREAKRTHGTKQTISVDGTYQRRGFQSRNGIVTALTVNGKSSRVIDTETLSNHCQRCKIQKKKRTPEDFQRWKLTHADCDQNHHGSAGAMEPAGTERIFRRSEELYQLQYSAFLGDGDSKAYSAVKNADPPVYDGVNIERLECCGHVQKRMGRHLTNKVNEMKNRTFRHNGKTSKGIGGKGKLTKKAILKIQGNYGAAIRNNVGDVAKMKKDIWAIWKHRNRDHTDCGDWCPSKTGNGDPDANAFPPFVCEAIRPVFEALSSDSLLQKCAHGGSQNTNESFHNMIWERCPKTTFVGRSRLTLAVEDATIVYNEGEMGRLDIFRELGMPEGFYTVKCFKDIDKSRVTASFAKATPAAKAARRRVAYANAQLNEDTDLFYQAGAHE